MNHSLYENNSAGYSPYGSCNINYATGCELDSRCTLFQQCVPLAARDLANDTKAAREAMEHLGRQAEESTRKTTLLSAVYNAEQLSEMGIRPHQNMSKAEFEQHVARAESFIEGAFGTPNELHDDTIV